MVQKKKKLGWISEEMLPNCTEKTDQINKLCRAVRVTKQKGMTSSLSIRHDSMPRRAEGGAVQKKKF